jgi:hypothetical protein
MVREHHWDTPQSLGDQEASYLLSKRRRSAMPVTLERAVGDDDWANLRKP